MGPFIVTGSAVFTEYNSGYDSCDLCCL